MTTSDKPRFLPATESAARPGDFELGSIQSRAAARTRLELMRASYQATYRVIVQTLGGLRVHPESFGKEIDAETRKTVMERVAESSCCRYICDGTLFEIVKLGARGLGGDSLEEFIQRFPIENRDEARSRYGI